MNLAWLAVPKPLAFVLRRLPEAPPGLAVAAGLNLALAAGVLEHAGFDVLRNRALRLEAIDAGAGVTLTLRERGFVATRAKPDVTIRARLADFALLALRREDPDTLFFNRRLTIQGDTEIGLAVKNALDAADWDRLAAPLRTLLQAVSRKPAV